MQHSAHVHERAAHVHRLVAAYWDRRGEPHRAESERTAARTQQDAADRLNQRYGRDD